MGPLVGAMNYPGDVYFKTNYPVNQTSNLIKKFKFRMVKGVGVPWGQAPTFGPGYQPELVVPAAVREGTPSGPLNLTNQAYHKKFTVPLPSVLRYEMEVKSSAGALTDADKYLPVNYSPVMAVGFFDNATGTIYEGGAPLEYNYEMKLTYKDL